jgi:hypothetical protein
MTIMLENIFHWNLTFYNWILKISLADGQSLEFILAVPGTGCFPSCCSPCMPSLRLRASRWPHETSWERQRLVVAHNPQRAQEQTDQRTVRIAVLS